MVNTINVIIHIVNLSKSQLVNNTDIRVLPECPDFTLPYFGGGYLNLQTSRVV